MGMDVCLRWEGVSLAETSFCLFLLKMWAIIRAAQFEGLPTLKSGWSNFGDGANTQVECIQFIKSKYLLPPFSTPPPILDFKQKSPSQSRLGLFYPPPGWVLFLLIWQHVRQVFIINQNIQTPVSIDGKSLLVPL